jgi:hypothetical protein
VLLFTLLHSETFSPAQTRGSIEDEHTFPPPLTAK